MQGRTVWSARVTRAAASTTMLKRLWTWSSTVQHAASWHTMVETGK